MIRKITLGLASLLLCSNSWAQIIDTVCPGEKNQVYEVVPEPGANYQWEVQGGSLNEGSSGHKITIDWGTVPGLYELRVTAYNVLGCPSDVRKAQILIKGNLPEISYPAQICKNDTATIQVNGASQVIWNNAETGFTRQMKVISDTGGWVFATDYTCPNIVDTFHFQIKLSKPPNVDFSPDSGIYSKDETITVKYLGGPENKLNWQVKRLNIYDRKERNLLLHLSDTGLLEIKLIAVSSDGCVDSAYRSVYVKDEYLYAPNAFSPNGDGLNDYYRPVHGGINDFDMKIFSRWGEVLYETNNPAEGWDGTYLGQPVPPDSYIYIMSARGHSGKEYYLKGSVMVIR